MPVESPEEQREKYVEAFHTTMLDIWHEKIALLGAIDTGYMNSSLTSELDILDSKITHIKIKFGFVYYGTYVERGTGRETPRGNPGDIGRKKIRKARPWLTKKYYASLYNIRDYMLDSLRVQCVHIIDTIIPSK